jgi:PAS domain S-box-containing protein
VATGEVAISSGSRSVARDLVRIAVLAAAYFGAAKLGLLLAVTNSSVSAVWPPSGLALAAVVVWGPRVWPGIWLGALLANLTTQGSFLAVLGIATGNTLEPLVGAFLLSRVGFRRNLERIRDVAAIVIVAGVVSTTVSATIGVASLAADGLVRHGMFLSTWRLWWMGDLGGDVLVASALLVLTASPRPPQRRLWRAEAVALAVVLAAVSVIGFSGDDLRVYVTLPLLFWSALRFGQPGAVCGGLVVAALATWFTTHAQGPFLGGTLDSELLRSQTFVAIATVTALLVGAARSELRSSEEAETNLREVLSGQRRQAEALREAEERFRGAFENAAIGMALVAPDGRWLRVNRAVCEIVGYSEQEMLEQSFQDITHPDDLDKDLAALGRMLAGELRSHHMDKRYIHRDGHVVWITLSVSLVHDPAGEPLYFVTQIEDITERKRSHMALEATVEIARAVAGETELGRVLELIAKRSRALVDASGLAILLADGDEFVVAATAGALPKTLVGRRLEARGSIAERVRATGEAHRVGLLDGSGDLGLAPLEVRATSVLAVPLGFRGATLGVIAAVDRSSGPEFGDEDERLLLGAAASAGTAIATAQSVGRDRLRRTMQASENERRRWARELHDETLQALAGLRVLLSTAQRSPDEQLFRRATSEALDQLDTEIESLRVLISELRPAALDELGLRAAVVALAERTSVRHGIDVTTTIDPPQDPGHRSGLDPERETVVYRVVQEALTNAARHARPESVAVRLSHRTGEVHVSITDDGEGFDPTAPTEGFGLVGMRERVSLVGGRFELASSSGGTTVAVSLPARGDVPAPPWSH